MLGWNIAKIILSPGEKGKIKDKLTRVSLDTSNADEEESEE